MLHQSLYLMNPHNSQFLTISRIILGLSSLEALQLAIYKIILPAEMKWDTDQNIVVLIS